MTVARGIDRPVLRCGAPWRAASRLAGVYLVALTLCGTLSLPSVQAQNVVRPPVVVPVVQPPVPGVVPVVKPPVPGAVPAVPGAAAEGVVVPEEGEGLSLWERFNQQTLGGVLLWGDELFFHDWRIQRHVMTGHCRLLDGDNRRYESGSYDQCLAKLQAIKRERNLPPMSGRAVVLVHGLGGVRATMSLLGSHLEKQGYKVFNMTYPSTRGDLAQHARALGSIVAGLEGIEELNFVGHSMGNLVIRHYLGDCLDPASGRKPDARLRRIVMLAPPNHGADKARDWGDNVLFVAVAGAGALQLGAGWDSVEKRLATPWCEFGIIAGGKGDDRGYSDSLPGDDDSLISVATTRLAGARDFIVVPSRHTLLLLSPTVAEYTGRFLAAGYFRTAETRQPILAEPPPAPAVQQPVVK